MKIYFSCKNGSHGYRQLPVRSVFLIFITFKTSPAGMRALKHARCKDEDMDVREGSAPQLSC